MSETTSWRGKTVARKVGSLSRRGGGARPAGRPQGRPGFGQGRAFFQRAGTQAAAAAAAMVLLLGGPVCGEARRFPLDRPVGPVGTLRCRLDLQRAFRNGADAPSERYVFLAIPGLAEGLIQQNRSQVGLSWRWIGVPGAPRLQLLVPELPGPEAYYLQITWDAARGRLHGYVNGFPLQGPGARFSPWSFSSEAREIECPEGPITVSDVRWEPRFLSAREAEGAVPADLRGRNARVFAAGELAAPVKIAARKGRLLLETPLASPDDVAGWVLEGPGRITFADGWMQMRSTRPDASGGENGHIVFWCPQDFPDRLVAEWEIQLMEDFGLCIVFFAARGEHGEDLFDPRLPPRDGTFAHYIRGAINSYHVSYYANTPGTPARISSNLRKNNQFYLISSGPIAVPAGSKRVHRMRLVKDGGHIQLQADGRVFIDYTDPGGSRYGPVYGGGKIGLRQMQWTVGRYRNLRVWELLPRSGGAGEGGR